MQIPYNNLFTHLVLTTKGRVPLIPKIHRVRIEKYITGVVDHKDCKLYSIYANPEHVHILISRSPTVSEERIATMIADASEFFINKHQLCKIPFHWQQTASAFSVSKGDVNRVCRYILNQPNHHRTITYDDENQELMAYYQASLFKR